MRKIFCVLLSAAMVLSADALGDPQAAPGAGVTKAKKCLFPNSGKRAPAWVCNARAEGMALTAVGSAAKSGAGIAFMEQMAAADARARLAGDLRRSVETRIQRSTDSSKNKAGRDGALITRITNDSLQGAATIKSAYGPDGTLYVLVGLDEANANRLIESITADYLARKRQ